MSQQPMRAPLPIFGIMLSGEKRTIPFGVLPNGVMPIVQNYPGRTTRLVEQGPDSVTIQNTGTRISPFMVLFVTQDQLMSMMTIKQVASTIAARRKAPKK